MKRLAILLMPLLLLTLSLGAIGCGGEEEPTPTRYLTCLKMQMAVRDHLDAMSTSYHARQVFAELRDAWFFTRVPYCQFVSNGEVYIALTIRQSNVEGNSLLEPIFRDPHHYCESAVLDLRESADSFGCKALYKAIAGKCIRGDVDIGLAYSTEWVVTGNGEVSPFTGNAIRLEAELGLIP